MNKYHRRSGWSYCRLILLSILGAVVGSLVVLAILSRADFKTLVYVAVVGAILAVISLKR